MRAPLVFARTHCANSRTGVQAVLIWVLVTYWDGILPKGGYPSWYHPGSTYRN